MIERGLAKRFHRYADDIMGIGALTRVELADKCTDEALISSCIKNKVYDFLRKEKYRATLELIDTTGVASNTSSIDAAIDMSNLDETTKNIIAMRLRGCKYSDISKELNMSIRSIYKKLEVLR